jgi:NAD(P)-dependent dehydrogenase (short-subunit alcohol dehydrogenase family)
MNPFTLEGKKILITGASSGIGQQCAISCSQMGAIVTLIGRNKDNLQKTMALLSRGNHQYFVFDVTDYSGIEGIVNDAVRKTGKVSGFIHSAGIDLPMPLNVTKPENYEALFATNVIAGFEFAKILSKRKYSDDSGSSFVFIASIMSVVGNPSLSVYSASKGAIVAGIRSIALEFANKKIRVNAISPGQICNTKMTDNKFSLLPKEDIDKISDSHPLGLGSVEDVANGCIYLLSDASKWITGTNLIIDGGYSAR